MSLTFILCLIQLLTVSGDSTLVQESKSQAEYYISQIERDRQVEENLWALSLLGSKNAEVRSFIEEISGSTGILRLFNHFEDTLQGQLKKVVYRTGAPNLLIGLLLATEEDWQRREIYDEFRSKFEFPSHRNIDYPGLAEAIISRDTIDKQTLSAQQFLLPHFFLLFNNNSSAYFTEEYYQELLRHWQPGFSAHPNLRTTLAEASYFRVLYLTDRYSASATLYNSLINDQLFPNSSLKLKVYQYLDYAMYRLGYFDRSLKIVRTRAIPLSGYLGDVSQQLNLQHLKGVYLYSIGKIQEAEITYQKVLKEIDEQNPQIRLSSLYNNLALAYHKLGKYNEYLNLQFKALETAETNNNYSHQLEILNNLFIYYRKTNDPENALNYLERAQQIAENRKSSDDLGTIYTSLGSFYRKFRQNYDKAHEYYAKAEEALDAKNNARYYITLLNEQAEAYENQGEYEQAIDNHNQVIAITNKKNGENYIDALVNKALLHLKMDNMSKAGELIAKFKSLNLSQLDFQKIIKAKTVEANYLHKTGNSQQAIKILNPALEQVVIRAKSSADLKSGFWHVEAEYLDAFDLAVSIYIAEGQLDRAVKKLDQLKTINDASLYQNPLVKSSLLNESELTQYKQLTNQLDAQRKKLLTVPENEQLQVRQTISKLTLKKRKLDKKLTQNVRTETIALRKVQNQLSARELVMHVTELKDQYYIANISRSDIQINTVRLDSTIRNTLSAAVQQISTNETDLDSLYTITKLLGIEQIPDRIEKITIIPDSYLYQLPIDILPLEKPAHEYSYGSTTYLIEKFTTQYLTSLNDFSFDNNSEPKIDNNLGFVGYGISNFSNYDNQSLVPLPFATKEVTTIAKKLTSLSDIRTFTNNRSTKTNFTQTAPKAKIVHMATHSKVSELDPMFSTMYMSKAANSPDNNYQNQIFAYELFEMNLNNEMVMLNSCESGSGSYIQGTGVMGISRALRYAGANSLVLNLWSVNDMLASDFAIYFYDQLNQGKSKAEALQNTKKHFLQNKNASPHFWGPYMLIGDTEPIVSPNEDNNIAMASLFLIYFVLMAGLSYLADRGIIFRDRNEESM